MKNEIQFATFLNFMKDGDWITAKNVVLKNCTKDFRVDEVLKLVKSTSMRSHRQTLQTVEKHILDYRKGNINDLEMELIIGTLRKPTSCYSESQFFRILSDILTDLKLDQWKYSAQAIIKMHYHIHNDKKMESFVANMATKVWPDKGLFGAIYG